MEIKFFTTENIKSATDVKKQYKELILIYHPDRNNNSPESNENMKQINAEYEYLLPIADKLEEQACKAAGTKKTSRHNINDGYRELIEKFVFIPGLKIEIIGAWVWISGNTYANYNLFKENDFKFSNSKKAWYWYDGITEQKQWHRGHYNMKELRSRWGSTEVEKEENKVIEQKTFNKNWAKYEVVA